MQASQQNSDDRGVSHPFRESRKSEVGEQRSDVGGQRSEVGGQRSRSRLSSVVHRLSSVSRASSGQRLVAAIVCLGIILFFGIFALAGHYKIDMGHLLGYCGFKQTTGLPCPTCGMTTATLAFAQGRIFEAFYIQPACGLLCSILVIVAVLAFIIAVFGIYFRFIERFFTEVKLRYMILALIIIIVAGWAVTLARAVAAKN
jgi:hypothetical protein